MTGLSSTTKRAIKALIFRPRGVEMGADSWVKLPWRILNRERIRIGARCSIGSFVYLDPIAEYAGRTYDGSIRIGDDVYIGGFCQIHAMSQLEIGSGCVLSEYVYISDDAHGLNPNRGPIMQQPLESKGPVRVGNRVFIGFGASVLPGVTLGDHCVVGTRAVVTRSFPACSMVAGAPAQLIKVFDWNTSKWVPAEGGESLEHVATRSSDRDPPVNEQQRLWTRSR